MRRDAKGRILLVNPWITDFAAYDFWLKPLGLLCIASILKQNAYYVDLLDCMDRHHSVLSEFSVRLPAIGTVDGTGHFHKEIIAKPYLLRSMKRRYGRYGIPKTLLQRVLQDYTRPDAVFITSGMTYWYTGVFEMISLIKKTFPGVPVVLGGIYATLCMEHAQQFSGADHVVAGHGEIAALRLADEVSGQVSEWERYESFENLPAPSYELYDRLPTAAVMTSRGCPYHCDFCASTRLYKMYRRRTSNSVIEEINRLVKRIGVEHIAFYDDALLYNKESYFIPILEEIVHRKIDVQFHTPNGLRPREIETHLALLMKKVNFKTIRLSFESINQNRQPSMSDKVKPSDLKDAVQILHDVGYDKNQIGCYILAGLPDQTLEEILESMRFVFSLGVKTSLSFFSPIPGTKIYDEAIHRGFLPPDPDPLLTNNTVFPVNSGLLPQGICFLLSTLAATANFEVTHGRNPLKDNRVIRLIDQLSDIKNVG